MSTKLLLLSPRFSRLHLMADDDKAWTMCGMVTVARDRAPLPRELDDGALELCEECHECGHKFYIFGCPVCHQRRERGEI